MAAAGACAGRPWNGLAVEASSKRRLGRSMRRWWEMKKSAPRMGRLTLAIQKDWLMECPGANDRVIRRRPKVAISVPLAATKDWERGRDWSWAVAGKTLSSAPESTRKDFREAWSQMVIVLGEWEPAAETSNGRRTRFPGPVVLGLSGGVPGCLLYTSPSPRDS